jgi:hypothetical protein
MMCSIRSFISVGARASRLKVTVRVLAFDR